MFVLKIPIKLLIVRNVHTTQCCMIFWQRLRKITSEKLEIENLKLTKSSDELFQLSEHKINELKVQKQIESEEYVKRMIFEEAILIYLQRHGKTRRGHVEFINSSLKKMKEFGVNENLEVYKKILEIFPEVKMIPRTFWQTEFFHYPKQQECAIDILVAMEENGVMPDEDFGRMIYKRFGLHTSPMVRYQRMMYWMPKFRNANPWPVPKVLPRDPAELGRIALTRMSPAKETEVTVHEVEINEFEKTWIASAQSNVQKNLISYLSHSSIECDKDEEHIAYVDGPFQIWLRNKNLHYYLLTTDIDRSRSIRFSEFQENKGDFEKVHFDNWYTIFEPETQFPHYSGKSTPTKSLPRTLTKYEDDLDNRSILASCVTGTESLSSLRIWVNMIIKENPELNDFKIVFRIKTTHRDLVTKQCS